MGVMTILDGKDKLNLNRFLTMSYNFRYQLFAILYIKAATKHPQSLRIKVIMILIYYVCVSNVLIDRLTNPSILLFHFL